MADICSGMLFKKKKIILSFDYELFFGDCSGTVQKTLIDPTNKILDAMDSVGFQGNFFVDWQMLKYLKEVNTKKTIFDLNMIINQLKDIIERGHRIELHIHPHWIDAKYNGDGTWNFSDFQHYSLNRFTEEEIIDMFVEGTSLLTSIAHEVDLEYKIVAFRAGGWAVQPFSLLKKAFNKSGIKIDSSVAAGVYGKNQYSYFDFIDSPKDIAWIFENDVLIPQDTGSFIEVPISSYKRAFLHKAFDYIARHTTSSLKPLTDGTHFRSDLIEEETSRAIRNMSRYTMSQRTTISVLLALLENKANLITYIDHSKDLSTSALTSIKVLSYFARSITYKQIYEQKNPFGISGITSAFE